MAQYRRERLRPIAFGSSLLAEIGVVAVLLASVGLFAVVAFSVSQRTREIGVRMALGAPPQRVTSMFVMEGMRLAAIGILAGSVMAMGAARVVASNFTGLAPSAVGPLVAVSAMLLVVAAVASWAGARRAAEVDPIEALRAH
jgi:ABC-type antimicrobial peptide transport system permease subunit